MAPLAVWPYEAKYIQLEQLTLGTKYLSIYSQIVY